MITYEGTYLTGRRAQGQKALMVFSTHKAVWCDLINKLGLDATIYLKSRHMIALHKRYRIKVFIQTNKWAIYDNQHGVCVAKGDGVESFHKEYLKQTSIIHRIKNLFTLKGK